MPVAALSLSRPRPPPPPRGPITEAAAKPWARRREASFWAIRGPQPKMMASQTGTKSPSPSLYLSEEERLRGDGGRVREEWGGGESCATREGVGREETLQQQQPLSVPGREGQKITEGARRGGGAANPRPSQRATSTRMPPQGAKKPRATGQGLVPHSRVFKAVMRFDVRPDACTRARGGQRRQKRARWSTRKAVVPLTLAAAEDSQFGAKRIFEPL